ncbi:MAG: BrxA/BrxB family bacilliredoxin [Oligoflexia bacterium]|nr:BrxA/BrxB family bacilliredoxin [Oligoflexia bacterium]
MYDENWVKPMRAELTALGIKELRTAAEVDQAIEAPGTLMIVVNSICGCSAAGARPAVAKALKHSKLPARTATVFAGQDKEATARAREHFVGLPPSSPCVVLLKDGKVLHMTHRSDIEGRSADMIAAQLVQAFDKYC